MTPAGTTSWITVTDLDRTLLATHPWSLSGGGATLTCLQTIEGGCRSRSLSAIVV